MDNSPVEVIKELEWCKEIQVSNIESEKQHLAQHLEDFKQIVVILEQKIDCPYCFLKTIQIVKNNLQRLEISTENLIDFKHRANQFARDIDWESAVLTPEDKKSLLAQKDLP